MKARIEVDGRVHEATLAGPAAGPWHVEVDGEGFEAEAVPGGLRIGGRTLAVDATGPSVVVDGSPLAVRVLEAAARATGPGAGGGHAKVRPPMNGKLERILVTAGQAVERGQVLFILEAMKMQNEVRSPTAGTVAAVHLAAGAIVEPSQVVLELAPS